jgi:hypothetical protein
MSVQRRLERFDGPFDAMLAAIQTTGSPPCDALLIQDFGNLAVVFRPLI